MAWALQDSLRELDDSSVTEMRMKPWQLLAVLVPFGLGVVAWQLSKHLIDAWMPLPFTEGTESGAASSEGTRTRAASLAVDEVRAPRSPTDRPTPPRTLGAGSEAPAHQHSEALGSRSRQGGDASRASFRAPLPKEHDTVRWEEPGLCATPEARRRLDARSALLATFERMQVDDVVLFHDRTVRAEVLRTTVLSLRRTRMFINQFLGWAPQSFPPHVYVYRDVPQMLSVSCGTNKVALGYYDGAIHVSGGDLGLRQVQQSVAHEYTHHFLNSLGVPKPMWLHEGLAMTVAEEDWWSDSRLALREWLRNDHLDFAVLSSAFPHGADETFALAAYFQSYMMVEFIRERRGAAFLPELVNVLAERRLAAADAFATAAGLQGRDLEDAWREFVEHRLKP